MQRERHRWEPVCDPPRTLVRPVRIDPTGRDGPTRHQAKGPHWRRTTYGFYVPSTVDPDLPEQRILEQAMRLPEDGAVTGWASCRMHGASFFDGLGRDGRTRLPVPLAVGPIAQVRALPGSVVMRDQLVSAEVATVQDVPCTRRGRALFDAMRTAADTREATVSMDMMAAAGLVSVEQMRTYLPQRSGWKGVGRVRAALDLADENSRSPSETRMRLVWQLDAGLPRPLVNQPVWDLAGRLLGYADLLDPVAGVVGEYDGADHRSARRHSQDVAREHRFRDVGLEFFKVTGPDMARVDMLVHRMLETRGRARWLPSQTRRWTLHPPPDWELEPSLEEQFAYRELAHGLPSGTIFHDAFGCWPAAPR